MTQSRGDASYDHACRVLTDGRFRITWRWKGIRYSKETSERGARLFCKKWKLPLPNVGGAS